MKPLLMILCILLIQCNMENQNEGVHVNDSVIEFYDPGKIDLWSYIEVCDRPQCIDSNGKPNEAFWKKPSSRILYRPFKEDPVWIRFRLKSKKQSGWFILSHSEPRTDSVMYYRANDLTEPVSIQGDMHSSSFEKKRHVSSSYSFFLNKNETVEFYIQIDNPVEISLDFNLYNQSSFTRFVSRYYIYESVFFGCMLVLFVFYTILLVVLKLYELGIYVIYLFSIAIYFLSRGGFLSLLPVDINPETLNLIVATFPVILFFTGTWFARTFLETRLYLPELDRILRMIQYLVLIPILFLPFSRELVLVAADLFSIIIGPGFLILAFVKRKILKNSMVFITGWSLPIIVSAIENLVDLKFGGFFEYPETLLQFAIIFEFVVYSVFLGTRIRNIEVERAIHEEKLKYIEDDLHRARDIHFSLLPSSTVAIPGYDLAIKYDPVSFIGGDYYDIYPHEDGTYVLIAADVAGHGLPAALDAARVRIAFRSAARELKSPSAILENMSRSLIPEDHRYISAGCISIDPNANLLRISLAGHPRVLVVRDDGRVEFCGFEAPLLGMRKFPGFRDDSVILGHRDCALLFTDGFYDMQGSKSTVTDAVSHLPQSVAQIRHLQVDALIERLILKYDEIRGMPSEDDVTIIALKKNS